MIQTSPDERTSTMATEHYRNLIVGSGEGGKILAWNLAKRGEKTVVIERSMVGGSCPNVACLPSKNLIYSAKAVSLVDPKAGLGVVTGPVRVDMAGVARRKRTMIDGLMELHLANFRSSGAELVMGEARFNEPKTVAVTLTGGGTRHFYGDRVYLCVGSRASIPDIPGLAAAGPMTHVEALDLERLPEHLVVLGGGYVGLEIAQAMRRFGSRVTILQRGRQLLDREDPDVAAAVLDLMRDEGIDVVLQADVRSVTGKSGTGVSVSVRSGTSEQTVKASDILVAAGRTPNTDRLDAAKGNVRLDARSYIAVNDRLQTTAADVWAMGDCAGSPQFTHVGFDDFRVVLDNLSGGNRTTTGRLVPYCLFTDPELAHVGLNETEAKAKNISYRLARLPMSMVLRTRTLSQTRGFCKALIGTDDRILGFTAFGAEASEMMAAVQTAMLGGMKYTALRDAIFTHPTAAEGLVSLFGSPPKDPGAV
jgi:pyruvate/2-oxoglutarate dehydrogenase complex dihydrolipoamide dehydrogenase (E3) component